MHKMKADIRLADDVKDDILYITRQFHDNGYECYLVGGSVRDLLLGNAIYDYDFAVQAKPKEIMKIFPRVIPTGIKHGTVSIKVNDRLYEATTFRADGKYVDGRRPETISFSQTLEEDVKRRDFTINGLAYDPLSDEITDYVNGIQDLQDKIIRTIGDPLERFSEDGLRPLRACRFASKLHFTIEDATFNAIADSLDIARLISSERIRDEFVKILESEKPSIGIEYLRRSGLLEMFLPELYNCYGVEQNKYHSYDIYYHGLYSCDAVPAEYPLIRLTALLHDIGKLPTKRMQNGDYTFYNHEVVGAKLVRKILKRLKFSNDEIELVNTLVLNHMFHYTDDWNDGAVRRFMCKVGLENIDVLFILRQADRIGNGSREGMPAAIGRLIERIDKAIEDENAITVKDLQINGHILMNEFDFKPGPVIGKILNDLLEMVLDEPEKNTPEILLEKAREYVARLEKED